MSSRYRATAFYGLVFPGGEREGDCDHQEGVAFPFVDDAHFAVAAAATLAVVDPEHVTAPQALRVLPRMGESDRRIKAWCAATGRPYTQPRWWLAGAWTG